MVQGDSSVREGCLKRGEGREPSSATCNRVVEGRGGRTEKCGRDLGRYLAP